MKVFDKFAMLRGRNVVADTDLPSDQIIAQHRRIFRGANDYGYFDWNLEQDLIRWNGGYWEMLGYSQSDVEVVSGTLHYLDYVHLDDVPILMGAIRETLQRGGPMQVSYRVRRKDGGWVWTEIHADDTRDERGWVHYISGIVLDVTRRKKAEEALVLSEARHARIIESSNDGFWEWSAEHGGFSFSTRCWELLGYEESDDQVNRGVDRLQAWRRRIHPEDGLRFDAALEVHIRRQQSFDVEYRIRHKDDSWVWIRGRGNMTFDESGMPLRMSGTNLCISALKRAEEKVIAAKEQAEAANRAKSDFLSSMSHELRTPLNAILGFAHLLEQDIGLTGQQRNNVAEITKAGRYLLNLVGDVLDLAKIEAGHMDVAKEAVDVMALLKESLGYVRSLAEEKSIKLTLKTGDLPALRVCCDETRMKQVFLNLLSNAVKYNVDNGEVVVECSLESDKRLKVAISDTGPGIPENKADQLFQPFCRLGAEQSDIEGSGVGLVITRQLLDAMEGEIGYHNREQGGCCFWLTIPLMVAGTSVKEVAITSSVELHDVGKRRVLYIEDNPANQRLLQQLFQRYRGVSVEVAGDAIKGVFCARTVPPDLIVMDINLPGMNGFEALEILRSDPRTQHIPVVALSANAMSEDKERGLAAGFDAYLTKPLVVPQLITVLNQVWASAPERSRAH